MVVDIESSRIEFGTKIETDGSKSLIVIIDTKLYCISSSDITFVIFNKEYYFVLFDILIKLSQEFCYRLISFITFNFQDEALLSQSA